jgi:hypothetical protein
VEVAASQEPELAGLSPLLVVMGQEPVLVVEHRF